MKRLITLFALASSFSIAADFTGYIIDESCSTKPAMKGNEACAKKCIKGGSAAVLLTADDKAKVSEHAGHKVVVTGNLNGETIKVEAIRVDSGCVPGPTGCQ